MVDEDTGEAATPLPIDNLWGRTEPCVEAGRGVSVRPHGDPPAPTTAAEDVEEEEYCPLTRALGEFSLEESPSLLLSTPKKSHADRNMSGKACLKGPRDPHHSTA